MRYSSVILLASFLLTCSDFSSRPPAKDAKTTTQVEHSVSVVDSELPDDHAVLSQEVEEAVAEDFLQDLYPTLQTYWQHCAQYIVWKGGRSLEDAYIKMHPADVRFMSGEGYFIVDTFFEDSAVLWYGTYEEDGTFRVESVNWPVPLGRCGG